LTWPDIRLRRLKGGAGTLVRSIPGRRDIRPSGLFLFFLNLFVYKENSFRAFRRVGLFAQSFTMGLAAVLVSFAYVYGAASVITALKRIGEVSWSLLSGRIYFNEKHVLIKLFLVCMFGFSIVLLLP